MNIPRTALLSTAIVSMTLISSCGKGDDTGETSSAWSILADEVGEGVLLSAWSNGDEVMMVGGGMDGDGPGVIAHYNPDLGTICTETAADDGAIWGVFRSSILIFISKSVSSIAANSDGLSSRSRLSSLSGARNTRRTQFPRSARRPRRPGTRRWSSLMKHWPVHGSELRPPDCHESH